LKVVYSFNKTGFEADYWAREIAGASTSDYEFIPFNHGNYLSPSFYLRAQLLDNLYFQENPQLFRMYAALRAALAETRADVLLVDTCPPYHPEFLRTLKVYKLLRIADGPMAAYDRDFAYVHAYDHILYHSRAYSRDMGIAEKLEYVGAKKSNFWPLALFSAMFDATKTEQTILAHERPIDIIFVGALHPNKMPLLAKVKKAFGTKFRIHGLTSLKKNIYFNLKYGLPGWVTPIDSKDYVALYQRAKLGINVHNRGKYTVGSYRLFDLPGNGVLQLSDGEEYLSDYFAVPNEIVSYRNPDDLIEQAHYFLGDDKARNRVALASFRRATRDHTINKRMGELVEILKSNA
jgi:hypothetical protein